MGNMVCSVCGCPDPMDEVVYNEICTTGCNKKIFPCKNCGEFLTYIKEFSRASEEDMAKLRSEKTIKVRIWSSQSEDHIEIDDGGQDISIALSAKKMIVKDERKK